MSKNICAMLYLVLLPLCTAAQEAANFNGSWTASYHTVDSGERVADVIIADSGGSWRDLRNGSQGKKNGCLEKVFPLIVAGQHTAKVKIAVNSSGVMPSCVDRHVTLKAVDKNTLEGTFADGRAIKLVRQ